MFHPKVVDQKRTELLVEYSGSLMLGDKLEAESIVAEVIFSAT